VFVEHRAVRPPSMSSLHRVSFQAGLMRFSTNPIIQLGRHSRHTSTPYLVTVGLEASWLHGTTSTWPIWERHDRGRDVLAVSLIRSQSIQGSARTTLVTL